MADSLTVSAFLVYAQAALKENGSGVREVSSMKDAISGEVLENASAYILPCPDMGQLKPEDPRASEFIKLYTLILLRQAVWSEANEHYVKVIQGLEEKYQECLKEIIERALTGLAEVQLSGSGEEERDDTGLREAELCYRLAKKASDIESQFNHVPQGNIKSSSVYADALQESTTPIHEGFNFTIGESESDTESEIIDSRPEGASSKTPARVSDRIKELEIERLSSDLDEKVDELKQLETQLEESRQNIAELESQVAEIDRLHVDVEIHRHASEKLRKCENVVDKLRKKLDSASNARSEIQESESQLSELLGRIGQLELALQNKQAEVVQLKEITVRREERDVDGDPYYASSEDEQGSGQKPKIKARPLSSSLRLPESPTQGLGTPREVIAQSESVSQRPLERIDKLERQLAEVESNPQRLSAEKYHAEKESVTSGNLSSAAQNGGSEEITKLQDEVTRLQQALAEAERRYRAEKLLMLRAWTELGQRTMKMGVGVNVNGGSTGNENEGMELGRPVGLSWASRVRQRVSILQRLLMIFDKRLNELIDDSVAMV
ncbi:hypothetical protein QFC22_003914 [Naganishia vaughanmartiniae]|uniref:Uncharacterized protein n=1 Tax=Naganishia vaughanmartiniae TaxID=1424756 RepID=A0ACC2X5R7_9TREE|nr:hypothetical protein QFC22_003914 [Naganishia vaughanmartiniae]